MEVRIINKFHDKADYTKVYLVGETLTFDDARAESLIARGLAECAEESPSVLEAEPIVLEVEEIKEEAEVKVSKVQPIVKSSAKKKSSSKVN